MQKYTKNWIKENKTKFLEDLLKYTEENIKGDHKLYTDGEGDSNLTKYEKMLNRGIIIIKAKSISQAKLISIALRYHIDDVLYLHNLFGEDECLAGEYLEEYNFEFKKSYTIGEILNYFNGVHFPYLEEIESSPNIYDVKNTLNTL